MVYQLRFYLVYFLIVLVCTVILWVSSNSYVISQRAFEEPSNMCKQDIETNSKCDEYKRQRNELSILLNEAKQRMGQADCEHNKSINRKTSFTGGWCFNESKEDGGQHITDIKLTVALGKFLAGKSVASFGEGPGAYKRLILKTGLIRKFDAYDGAPYSEEITNGEVKYLDLSIPQYDLPICDWGLSLETAEHIPKEFESIYLENIIRHVRYGVIMSWAVVGQGGLGHVNCRSLEYVEDKMRSYRFFLDKTATRLLRDNSTFYYFRKHILVFRRDTNDITK